MRRYRNSYFKRKRYWRSSIFQSPKSSSEILREKARSSSLEYVKKCFFSFQYSVFEAFIAFYTKKYSSAAGAYLRKTYPDWRSGHTAISGQTATRILNCVPRFMSREEQVCLLRFYLPWHNNLKETDFANTVISISDLTQKYHEAYQHVLNQSIHLDWFISEVFSNDEIKYFIDGFKYMLLKRLELSYQGVCRDLMRLGDLFDRVHFPVNVEYKIDYLGCLLTIESSRLPRIDAFKVTTPIPPIFQTSENHILNVLCEDILEIKREQQSAQINALVSSNDLDLVVSKIGIGKGQEIDTRLEALGEGGRISLHFVRKDIRRLRQECTKAAAIFMGVSFLIGALAFHAIENKYFEALVCPFGIFILLIMGIVWSNYSNAKTAFIEYEQQTPIRLTKN